MSEFRKWLDEKHGRCADVARELGFSHSAVKQWGDGQVPAERIFAVSRITGLPLAKLRPDLVSDGEVA